ncbi:MAG: TRAP transporter small permease [Hyphomicrobiales bacterium]|nr:TRAP transporter small permease [Hyphomicrobiales bacterium]MCP5372191.1 TRAP transporter small permease [Hyphomicrobiales bacterium]
MSPLQASSPTRPLAHLDALVTAGAQRLAYVAVFCLVVIGLATMVDVLMRWLANAPLHGLEDVIKLAVAVVVTACLPAGMAKRSNIAIRFLGDTLGRTAHGVLELFGDLATLAFLVVLTWQLAVYTAELGHRTTLILELPTQPSWIAACVLAVLACAVQALRLVVSAAALARPGGAAPR